MQSGFGLPYRPGYTMCLCLCLWVQERLRTAQAQFFVFSATHESPPTTTKRQSFSHSSFLCLFTGLVQDLCICACACMHACIRTPHIFIHQLWLMIQKRAGAGKTQRRAGQIRSAKPQSRRNIFSVEEERDTDTYQQLILSPRYRGTDGDYQIEWSSPTGCG